jgi:hypothetical protein
VNRDHGRRHHRRQHGGHRGRQQPERRHEAADELRGAGDAGVEPAGTEAELVERLGGAVEAAAAEDAEQLLGAVGRERQPDDHPKHE